MSGTYSTSDVASHNKGDNLWIIVDEDVYDLTKFQDEHPGGKKSMYFNRLEDLLQRTNAQHSLAACGWQRCLQAVLEVSGS